jgi:hypothetical protein
VSERLRCIPPSPEIDMPPKKKLRKTVNRPRRKHVRSSSRPAAGLWKWLVELGPMRVFLVMLALVLIAGAPRPGTPADLDGAALWTTVLVPTLMPIVFMVLMLDALMGRILLGSARGTERARYRRIVTVNLAVGIFLVLWWVPYFVKLFRG